MSIDNANIVDGIGINKERKILTLLIADHLRWTEDKEETVLSEYNHLMLLQNKINAYIAYLESKQYQEQYPNVDIYMAIIQIHFKYEITNSCEIFLNNVQDQIGQYGIKIEAEVTKDNPSI